MKNIFDSEREMKDRQPAINALIAQLKRPTWEANAAALQSYEGKKIKLIYSDEANRPCDASHVIGVFRGMVATAQDGLADRADKFCISLQAAQCYSSTGSKIMGQKILETHIDNFVRAELA